MDERSVKNVLVRDIEKQLLMDEGSLVNYVPELNSQTLLFLTKLGNEINYWLFETYEAKGHDREEFMFSGKEAYRNLPMISVFLEEIEEGLSGQEPWANHPCIHPE